MRSIQCTYITHTHTHTHIYIYIYIYIIYIYVHSYVYNYNYNVIVPKSVSCMYICMELRAEILEMHGYGESGNYTHVHSEAMVQQGLKLSRKRRENTG